MDEGALLQPGTYFISHAYRDRKPLRRLLKQLPRDVMPYVFPPIQVSPVDFVSNPLIEALMNCHGVIVLKGGHSASSFWVAFERDYALRQGRPVFAFDPTLGQFERLVLHPDEPMTLPLAIHIFGGGIVESARDKVLRFLTKDRIFDPDAEGGSGMRAMERLRQGGYLIILVSGDQWEKYYRGLPEMYPRDRVILALLTDAPVPKSYNPDLVIRLYEDGAEGALNPHKLDDLVVRLYWMIFHNRTLAEKARTTKHPMLSLRRVLRAVLGAQYHDTWRKQW